MPRRVARSSLPGTKPVKARANSRNPKKAAKRALNAFSIAQYENPEKLKIRRNRLGEIDPSFQRKRPREDEDEEDEDEDEDGEPRKRKRRSGDDTFDEGSDSEGNTWTMGHIDVDDDDDEDIDSDEAFGESDEERFEDFTFRGSSSNQKAKKPRPRKQQALDEDEDDIDMEEGDSADGEEEEEEDDDLGEDAIDLATALDQYEEDEAEERRRKEKKKNEASAFDDSDEAPSEGEDIGADGASDLSSDEDEDDEEDRQAQLKDLISSLATESEEKGKGRRVEVHESAVPDEFGVARKVDLLSFKPKVADEERKRALKLLQDDKSSKRTDIARKLDAPLPKRQQDKLDRAAANAKANETLERWTDTIKRNRRAEHLVFPLQNKSGEPVGEKRLQPTTTSAPTNDLESTIQAILQQSGLSNGADDEDKILKGEELELNKRPIEEVMRNRAQLRLARELAFREEIRAKRIKKIKSKAYRRVHRKEREKLLEKERSQLKADGVDLSEEEREYNDRRRAEERMGAKHRESKWAKGIKATGRAAWDKDALDGVTEMARRNEELRRRVEGKTVRDGDEDASDLPSEDEESEDDSDVDNDDNAGLQQSLNKLKQNPFSTDSSKLGQMAFMQKAEAARRMQNDEDIERIRRELAGEDSMSEEEMENSARVGRRKYGPGKEMSLPLQINRNEFEEQPGSDEEDAPKATNGSEDGPTTNESRKSNKSSGPLANGLENGRRAQRKERHTLVKAAEDVNTSNPFLSATKKEKKKSDPEVELLPSYEGIGVVEPERSGVQAKSKSKPRAKAKAKANAQPQETTVDTFLQQRVTTADEDGWATVLGNQDDNSDADSQAADLSDEGIDLDVVLRNQALTAKGFAGDNVAANFLAEKQATIADEESTETVTHLPGWGSWTGTGTNPKQKGQKTVTKKAGIAADKRKDKKLDKVIINERRQKPTVKYMASQLPFPFESREQYERSLRVPKGKEWVSRRTFQDGTRPRVIVKQGVIAPLRKPLV